jgi:aryl-alcohol dehydrogenase-like predicted oxidoreductase
MTETSLDETPSSRLGVGTAQFGLDYAIAAEEKQPGINEVRQILEAAKSGGIGLLDTANRYGTAESVLGECAELSSTFRVVTKAPAFRHSIITKEDTAQFLASFEGSLENLKARSVYGLMTHWAPDLLSDGGEALFDAMLELKRLGKVSKIGSSVYTAEHVDGLLRRYPIDIIQLPVSILDQRLIMGGQVHELANRGVEIHVRSAFLKGLIFADPMGLPGHFDRAKSALLSLRRFADGQGLAPHLLALGFLLARPEFSNIIVGVTSAEQLQQLLPAEALPADCADICADFAIEDPQILDPNHWPQFKF